RLVQMGRIPDGVERHARQSCCARWLGGARCEAAVAHDRGGTRRTVVGSPNPGAIEADTAASTARLAVSLSVASARPKIIGTGRPRTAKLAVRAWGRKGSRDPAACHAVNFPLALRAMFCKCSMHR